MVSRDFFDNAAVNLLVHSVLLFAFLCGFFYLYISQLVDTHISDEVVDEARTLIENKYFDMNFTDRMRMSILLQSMPLTSLMDAYSKPDDVKLENNYFSKLSSTIIIVAMVCVIGVLIFTYTFRCNRSINLEHILLENIIIFFFVALIELGFFMYIASKYVPVMPSAIMKDMVDRIKTNFSKK